MRVVSEQFITEEKYWQLEAHAEIKHEYFNGEIFAMPGGSPEHAVLAVNASTSLNVHCAASRAELQAVISV